jgi:hypothetical protein
LLTIEEQRYRRPGEISLEHNSLADRTESSW